MTNYDKMCVIITDLVLHPGVYVAKLKYSYQSELYGIFDERQSWEVFDFDGDKITWFNDWYEGEDICQCEEIISLKELVQYYERRHSKAPLTWQEVRYMVNDVQAVVSFIYEAILHDG